MVCHHLIEAESQLLLDCHMGIGMPPHEHHVHFVQVGLPKLPSHVLSVHFSYINHSLLPTPTDVIEEIILEYQGTPNGKS